MVQIALVLALAVPVQADDRPASPPAANTEDTEDTPGGYELQNTQWWFLGLETLGAAVVFATYSIAAGDPPTTCSWCESNGFDDAMRDAFLMSDRQTPATISHVLSLGVIPVSVFTALLIPAIANDRTITAFADAWTVFNCILLITGLADGTKKWLGRERPGFHHGVSDQTEAAGVPIEQHLSFFSGDTAWAFGGAASAATLAFLHGWETAPFIAAGGGALALLTGILRMSADMHWATDVLFGAVVGTGVGIGIPLLLHRREPRTPTTATSPSAHLAPMGTGLQLVGAF